jgi:glyceraldehyde 3-phosphate dehydrogenase
LKKTKTLSGIIKFVVKPVKMKKIKVAINGFGRIGRLTFKLLLSHPEIEIIAINDLTDNNTLVHLLKYDSTHGKLNANITCDDDYIYIDNRKIDALAIKDPLLLPWKKYDIDIVLECTGKFRSEDEAGKHLQAGAKRVVISAPAKGNIKTVVLGVNEHILNADDKLISNASCTTNCLAPMIKVLEENFGLEQAFVTTVHAYTADQNLQDAPHKGDLRRARAAAMNIVPTTTNAGAALAKVYAPAAGKVKASAVRVPVIDGSLTEVNALLKVVPSKEQINEAFKKASETNFKGIIEYATDPLVSTDIIGNIHSTIFDSLLTDTNGNFIKITGWYDNESGYSQRLVDLIEYLQKKF